MSNILSLNNNVTVPQVGFNVQPNVPSLETNMTDVLGAARWAGMGEPPREYGKPDHEKNATIQYQHVITPWPADNSHERILKYHPVFVARNLDKEYGMHTDITLPKLNEILRTSHQVFKAMVEQKDANAVKFQTYLEKFGEDQLEFYHQMKRHFILQQPKMQEFIKKQNMFKEDDLTAEDMATFYEMATQPIYRYQTLFGILNKWNWWGVVINTNAADTLDSTYLGTLSGATHATTVNSAVKGYARMYNFVGSPDDTRPHRRVWLVLKRALNRLGSADHFHIVPVATWPNDQPDMYTRRYLEPGTRETFRQGHLWNIGIVRDPNPNDVPQGLRDTAIALNVGSERQAVETMPSLPQIVMQLGI